jgi:cation:H+ antiporter
MDSLIFDTLLLIIGFILLVKGADFLIKGAVYLALRFNISELAIGLTIVAFGTSIPELVVGIVSVMEGSTSVVFGNLIGSNSINILLTLGVAGIIYPLACKESTVKFEIPFSLIITLIFAFLANDQKIFKNQTNQFSVLDAVIIFIFFLGFLFYVFKTMRAKSIDDDITKNHPIKLWKVVLMIGLGLVGLITGGELVVKSAIEIARDFEVSEKLIGLTIIAGGTALPELAAASVAAYRKNEDIAVGNIIGSNIFNILFVLPTTTFFAGGLEYDKSLNFDIGIVCVSTILLLSFMFSGEKSKIDRYEAVLFLVVYVGYLYFLISRG